MPDSNPKVNEVVERLGAECPLQRRAAAVDAQNLIHGPLHPNPAGKLLAVLADKLKTGPDGPVEPCHFVREMAANSFELAHDAGHDVARHVSHLRLVAANDPHEWVRDAASRASEFITTHEQFRPGPIRLHPNHPRESHAAPARLKA